MDLSEVKQLAPPDGAELSTSAQRTRAYVEAIVIASDDDYSAAAEELQSIKGKHKALEEKQRTLLDPLAKVEKAIRDLFRGPLATLKDCESLVKGRMLAWDDAKRAEAKRIADEQAAAAQAARLEAARREREIREAAEREAAAAATAIEANAIKQAGIEQAAAARAVAEVVVAAPAPQPVTRGKGMPAVRETFDFEEVSLIDLVKFIANERPELVALLTIDAPKMRAQVKATGLATNLPGIRVTVKRTMASRSA